MATIIVQSTQAKDQVITDFPAGEYSAEEFDKVLQAKNISTKGMSISAQDLTNFENVGEALTVRDSHGNWGDSVLIEEEETFLVHLNPKSTSNG